MADNGPERRSRFRSDMDVRSRLHFARRQLSPMVDISIRIAIAVGAIVITTVIVYLEGDCYQDGGKRGGLSWIDSAYYAAVTLSTTGYGDITPVCESSRLMNVIVITPLRFLFLIVLVGTTISALTGRMREDFRRSRWRRDVKNHTIIVGYGVKGRSAARALRDAGVPTNSVVVVSADRTSVDDAGRDGHVGVLGDARREEVLLDAAIERSSKVIIAVDEDDTSVLITLTARRLAPKARIVVSVRESVNAEILRQSGADTVMPASESAGRLLGLSLVSPIAGDLMEDLLDSTRGLEVAEREITREELGLSPSDLDARGEIVLAVVRHGEVHRFDQDYVAALQHGDRLVVIRHNDVPTDATS